MKQTIQGYLKLAVSMAIAGSSVVVAKLISTSFPVFFASCLRFAVALVILLPLLRSHRDLTFSISRRAQVMMLLQAVSGIFLFNVFLLYGVGKTGAMASGIILSTAPAVIGAMAFFFLKEKWNRNRAVGILLSVIGIMLIEGMPASTRLDQGSTLLGSLFILGAVVCEAAFTVLGKRLPPDISPMTITTRVSMYGFLLFLPFAAAEAYRFDFSSVTWQEWALILYSGIFVTVVSYLLWYQGLRLVTASTAAVFTGFMPISSILLSYSLLHEPFSYVDLIGVLCVLASVYYSVKVPASSAETPV